MHPTPKKMGRNPYNDTELGLLHALLGEYIEQHGKAPRKGHAFGSWLQSRESQLHAAKNRNKENRTTQALVAKIVSIAEQEAAEEAAKAQTEEGAAMPTLAQPPAPAEQQVPAAQSDAGHGGAAQGAAGHAAAGLGVTDHGVADHGARAAAVPDAAPQKRHKTGEVPRTEDECGVKAVMRAASVSADLQQGALRATQAKIAALRALASTAAEALGEAEAEASAAAGQLDALKSGALQRIGRLRQDTQDVCDAAATEQRSVEEDIETAANQIRAAKQGVSAAKAQLCEVQSEVARSSQEQSTAEGHVAHAMSLKAVLKVCSTDKAQLADAHAQSQVLQHQLDVMVSERTEATKEHSAGKLELQTAKAAKAQLEAQLEAMTARHQSVEAERQQHLETIRRSMLLHGGGSVIRTFFPPSKCDTVADVDNMLKEWGISTTSAAILQLARDLPAATSFGHGRTLGSMAKNSEASHRCKHFSDDASYGFQYLYRFCGPPMLEMLKSYAKFAGRSPSTSYTNVTSTSPSAAGFASTIEPFLSGTVGCKCGRPTCLKKPITTERGLLEFDMIIPVNLVHRTVTILGKHTSKIVLTQLVFMCVGALSFRPATAACNACCGGMGPSDAKHVASLLILPKHWEEVSRDCFGGATALKDHEDWVVKQQ